jgi:hypothetical protein
MKLKRALFGIAAAGGIALTSGSVSAMPNGLSHSISKMSKLDEARYVRNASGRCGWRHHGSYASRGDYRFYAPVWGYGGRHRGYPEDEHDMSPAMQAAEEGGR